MEWSIMKPSHRQALARALSRRTVLRSAGAAGVAAAGVGVTACSGPDEHNPRLPDPNAQATIAKSAVPEGSGVIVGEFVVTQPEKGEFAAYSAACPHQGCNVTDVVGDTIQCACHGSQFAVADGSMTQGPATTGLTPATVTEDGDELQLTA